MAEKISIDELIEDLKLQYEDGLITRDERDQKIKELEEKKAKK